MVIIFRGPSGSGKTTLKDLLASIDFKIKVGDEALEPSMTPAIAYAKVLWGSIIKSEHAMHICSADDFFMINGVYKFDAKLLGTAHATCLRNFSDLVKDPKNVIIVDNTNCSLAEFVPYAALANAYRSVQQHRQAVLLPHGEHQQHASMVPAASLPQLR